MSDLYQGKTALITGASSGIGEAFAHELARRGMHLILVARSETHLNELAHELSSRYQIQTHVLAADLSQHQAIQQIKEAVESRSLTVDLLINNAGFATYDYFEQIDPERDHQQVMVNVNAVVALSHAFLPGMLRRGAGSIINIASRGAFQPAPFMSVYAASKAFVLSFSQALWAEYRKRGIHVLAVCPGPVDTHFFAVAGGARRGIEAKATPEFIVNASLRALERRRSLIIPGWRIFLTSQIVSRLLPRPFVAQLVEHLTHPGQSKPTGQVVRA
ncbi:hypothetical protein EI42_01868 [Thermosporothrix hazakensis]|uniref:Ketoreductase domain-containing protein n=2 Tax=Thermosporothrix TaxID=768650 RepID=A0A326U9A8_THEHA|nr:SDR family oxidoreductase [Thermosporothrix hazakensis]PZW32776.1 hypothetical protein EI42_01868 [Thermosporothrix hazakensis]BBH87690.1 short-chain dehydrogenase [Thermosporothrix sp. COM3]GCE50132.1 short-chain dehydrogenase [Thermosporothrix hazakensis]